MKLQFIFLLSLFTCIPVFEITAQNLSEAKKPASREENPSVSGSRIMEKLNRGVVAIKQDESSVYIGWRLLGNEPEDIAFNLYRKTGDKEPVRLNTSPLFDTTNFVDEGVDGSQVNSYFVKAVLNGEEEKASKAFEIPANAPARQYLSVPLNIPPGGVIDGNEYSYSANDASVGDLNGDGEYEIMLKWQPSNAKNPPQKGFTGNQILDAYKLDGTFLWRMDLGKNIRAGAAYTQFLVYDLDGDGKAEIVCKTADGTKDGKGKIIGDPQKDWRGYDRDDEKYGKIASGPEYLTVFEGATGAALATTKYIPSREPLDGWGGIGGNGRNDNTASRADRFTAGVAYLDGELPSVVMVRGWYGRSVLAAWDWRNGKFTNKWVFDSEGPDNPYSGMGNHSLSVADVDGDGKDEICIGAMTVNNNGEGLYSTGLRHGDALHLGDLDPERPGLEVYGIHENEGRTIALKTPGAAMFDAATGEILWGRGPGVDVGRGVAADIDPTHPGFENWGGPGGLRDIKGNTITKKTPSSANFLVWWDEDLTRELLDRNYIDKWDWEKEESVRLFTAEGAISNNGTKATPCLSADLFGDWREEVIWRSEDNTELRIYTTTIPSTNRLYTLMHDPQYRLSIAWQNVAYNQPPHTGYFLGEDMEAPTKPRIRFPKVKE